MDSSVLARAYLVDEDGHGDVCSILDDVDLALITGTWTRVEVSGALVRAARAGRGDAAGLLAVLDADLADAGPVSVVRAPQEEVEDRALELVRDHAIRAMDAWHLATAVLVVPRLLEAGEEMGFSTRDQAQSVVAASLGFRPV